MTTADLIRGPRRLPELDPCAELARTSRTVRPEEDLLSSLWSAGEDVRLHEDERFTRSSHSCRWHLREQRLANDALYRLLLTGEWDGRDIRRVLGELDRDRGCTHVFDPDDVRFHQVCDGRWTAIIEDLPLLPDPVADSAEVLSLQAAGGSLEGGHAVDPHGWVKLREPAPERAFVARIVGRSMEPLLPDRSWALFKPDGGQGRVVLAAHPELRDGSLVACTVKTAIRDRQGNVGGLRAENPAFQGRPILPADAEWEDVRLVASLVRALSPADFVDLVVPGTRRLARGPLSEEDLQRRLDGLRRRLDSLLRSRAPSEKPSPAAELDPPWAPPHLVLTADGRSLRILIPGWPLPDTVRHVSVAGVRMLGRNLRREQLTPPVQPQVEQYAFDAADVAGGLQDHLRALAIPGLAPDRATVFRAPAQGCGLRLDDGTPLREGCTYRLLLPPTLSAGAESLLSNPWAEELRRIGEWTVLQMELPADDAGLDELLGELGLTRTTVGLELALVGPNPCRRVRLPSGLEAPVFSTAALPAVRITAAEPCIAGELHLLVVDSQEDCRIALGEGEAWTVAVSGLAPGPVLVETRATDREVEHDQLVFMVEDAQDTPAGTVPAQATLELGSRRISMSDDLTETLDVRSLLADGPDAVARVVGPPFWHYVVAWGTGQLGVPFDVVADESGVGDLPTPELRTLTAAHPLAQIVVDAAELGRVRLVHDAPPNIDELVASLRVLDEGRAVPLRGFAGAHEVAREWVLPVLRCVGFEPGQLTVDGQEVVVPISRLRPTGEAVFCEQVGLARVIRPGAGELAGLDGSSLSDPASPVGHLCQQLRRQRLAIGILTDGECWVRVEPLRFVPRLRVIDLRAALADTFDSRLVDFLNAVMD